MKYYPSLRKNKSLLLETIHMKLKIIMLSELSPRTKYMTWHHLYVYNVKGFPVLSCTSGFTYIYLYGCVCERERLSFTLLANFNQTIQCYTL